MQVGKKFWANVVVKCPKGSALRKGEILNYEDKKKELEQPAVEEGMTFEVKRLQILEYV